MRSKNSNFTGIMLLVMLFLVYNILTAPSKEEIEAKRKAEQEKLEQLQTKDSLLNTDENQLSIDSIQNDTTRTQASKDSLLQALQTDQNLRKYSVFSNASIGSAEEIILENEKIKIYFNSKGARISRVELKDYLQYDQNTEDPYDKIGLVLMEHEKNRFEYFIPLNATSRGDISTAELYFEPVVKDNRIVFRAYSNDRTIFIEQEFILGEAYTLDYNLKLEGLNELMPRDGKINLKWDTYLSKVEKNPHYEATMSTVYYKSNEEEFDYCNCRSSDAKELPNSVEWISKSQQFFNTSLFSKQGTRFSNAKVATKVVDETAPHLKELFALVEFDTKDQQSSIYNMQMYIGPNDYNELVQFGNEFERIIPFGWSIFGFISRSVIRPLFNLFANFISSYGLIILSLTFLIRLVLFPLQYKMILNGVKMSVLKPEMEAMRNKHKDDQAGMQAAQMKMYQEYGLNPLGGCLPMLLTMPIWIALYRFFPASIDFRQKSFLWADDLVSYDSILDFGNLPVIHQIYGDHVSLFTLLWMISMFGFLWYNSKNMDMTAGAGPNMKMMKYMQYSFPILFFFALNSWAAGLTAYMLFSNLLNIAQTFITKNVLIDKDKLKAEMMENKKNFKEKPQTGFMAKYQQLLKEQQEMEKRKKK